MGSVSPVSDAEFEAQVIKSDRPVLVDFWAPWCAPCRMISPVVDELAAELGEKVSFRKMDIDQNPQTAMQFGIMSIPTIVLFKDGKAADRSVGYKSTLKVDLALKLNSLV
jgi:thioredoxin 1